MKLNELLDGVALTARHVQDVECSGICCDTRDMTPGCLFVALPGYKTDGHRYIRQALEGGAAAVLCQRPPEGEGPWLVTEDTRAALAIASANWFGHPARELTLLAVTGTNGKTTTTYLLKAILEQAKGAKVGLIGTNQNMIGQEVIPTERTTPESFEVQKLFREMADGGCTHVVMETSSHALYLDRVYGVHYDVGVFTNLTQDHLDFHKTMENYCDAKAILFQNCGTGVVNADDPWTPRLLKNASCQVRTYGEKTAADLRAENIVLSADGIAFDAVTAAERVPIQVHIPGGFMVYNTLDVLAAAQALGVSLTESAAVLAKVPHVQGRVEVVPTPGKDYTILIDYAHTPDSMVNVLQTVKEFAKGRTVAVFGCGGARSRLRRFGMGSVCARLADFCIITEDNSRGEPVEHILADIRAGLRLGNPATPFAEIPDRRQAIYYALDHAQPGDIIAILGKGHETTIERGGIKEPFVEREIVEEYWGR